MKTVLHRHECASCENIPRKLQWRLKERGIEVVTIPDRGWAGVTNGELLSRAEGEFDALLTMD